MSESWNNYEYSCEAIGSILGCTSLSCIIAAVTAVGLRLPIFWTAVVVGYCAATIMIMFYKNMYRQIDWSKGIAISDQVNGRQTAIKMFGKMITCVRGKVEQMDINKFAKLRVENHRAQLSHRCIDDVYPEWDRPRELEDVRVMMGLLYASYRVPPVMILEHENRWILLDGAHRVAAAYLTKSPIRYVLYKLVEDGSEDNNDTAEK